MAVYLSLSLSTSHVNEDYYVRHLAVQALPSGQEYLLISVIRLYVVELRNMHIQDGPESLF